MIQQFLRLMPKDLFFHTTSKSTFIHFFALKKLFFDLKMAFFTFDVLFAIKTCTDEYKKQTTKSKKCEWMILKSLLLSAFDR
jgi:hypothetical protein